MKIAIWRAVPADLCLEGAPVLEFDVKAGALLYGTVLKYRVTPALVNSRRALSHPLPFRSRSVRAMPPPIPQPTELGSQAVSVKRQGE